MAREVTKDEISGAAERIAPHVRVTPILDAGVGVDLSHRLFLKLDNLQVTGSFKPRGAFSLLTASEIPDAGVVAASGGNFGLAVSHAARVLGFPATIFVPETSPDEKIGRIESHGADVRRIPGYYAEALVASQAFLSDSGAFMAHAYDDAYVMAGQGTCAVEIAAQVPEVDTVLVAVGGGGLIGGIASWLRSDAKVIAVEPALCPSFNSALANGAPTDVEVGGVAASSLGAARIGDFPWLARQWIDDSILVGDEEILGAQRWLWENARVLAETSASVPLAALLTGAYVPEQGETVVAVVSGANTDPAGLS